MAPSTLAKTASTLLSLLALANGQSSSSSSNSADGVGPSPTPTAAPSEWSTTVAGTPTVFRSIFTMPASSDEGAVLLPNIEDPQAVNAQDVCPGYKASQVQEDDRGLSAVLTLAGAPCNVYGTDVQVLNLKVEYQAANRLAINISPADLVRPNMTAKLR